MFRYNCIHSTCSNHKWSPLGTYVWVFFGGEGDHIYICAYWYDWCLIDRGDRVRFDALFPTIFLGGNPKKDASWCLFFGIRFLGTWNPTIYPYHYPHYPHPQRLQWITLRGLLGHSTWKLFLSWFAECIQNYLGTFGSNKSFFMDDTKFLNQSQS